MKIIIIGAGQGLGKVLSKMLRVRGHEVVSGFRNMNSDDWTKEAGILGLPMDVTDQEQMKAAAGIVKEQMGEVDAVVDVAGVLLNSDRERNLMEEPLEDVRQHLEVNAIGVLAAFRAFYPILKKGGKFLAVTSEGGSFTCAGSLFPAYGISKTAANKIIQTLRFTVDDVEILAVHPGRMNTVMGRTTAQIEAEEAAEGFCGLLEGSIPVDGEKAWFIDYKGNEMPL